MRSKRNCDVAPGPIMPDDEFQLPSLELPIIRHIQSFLTRKEAARTTILSKPWHTAWSTNGVLYLAPHNLGRTRTTTKRGGGEFSLEFQKIATKSINRYKTMEDGKLDELRLCMYIRKDNDDHEATTRFYDELILDALDLGVTVIDITVKSNSMDYCYTLPPQVFDSVSLKELSLDGCRVSLNTNEMRATCSGIVSLKLVHVEVDDVTMKGILSGCPLIEDLELYECRGLEKVNLIVVRRNLKNFSVRGTKKKDTRMLSAEFGTDDDHQYPNMVTLELDKVRVDDLFSEQGGNFSYRFPCLEKFKLREYEGPEKVEISSDSITCLSLIRAERLRHATVHLPNISNFYFTGNDATTPSLSFTTPDHKWKSCIELNYPHCCNGTWLRNFLTELSSSDISLVMNLTSNGTVTTPMQSSFDLPKVENLDLKFRPLESWYRSWHYGNSDDCCETVCGVLLSCSPKFITPSFEAGCVLDKTTYQCREDLYKTLKKHVNMKKCKQAQHGINCIHGLKEVKVEIYDQTLQAWQQHPSPEKAWEPECEGDKIRFCLKWN